MASTDSIIDTHVHLFDPARPGGIPWPEASDAKLYRAALPARYAPLAEPHGIVGAIAVECSSWLVDNFWLSDMVESSSLMLGFVGNLDPAAPDFAATLDRLNRSPQFLGIRYGNLWNRNLKEAAHDPRFIAGLKLLADADLVLDTANPNLKLITAVLEISTRVPGLRVIIDHVPHADIPAQSAGHRDWHAGLAELAQRPQVFIKGSEILRKFDDGVSFDLSRYKDNLDRLWSLFGEGRILFGSDWPNSDTLADYDQTFNIAQEYIATRTVAEREKYFWRNSLSAYKWRPRTPAQQSLARASGGAAE